jgi:hypothetical protein
MKFEGCSNPAYRVHIPCISKLLVLSNEREGKFIPFRISYSKKKAHPKKKDGLLMI